MSAICIVTILLWVVVELAVQFGHYSHECVGGRVRGIKRQRRTWMVLHRGCWKCWWRTHLRAPARACTAGQVAHSSAWVHCRVSLHAGAVQLARQRAAGCFAGCLCTWVLKNSRGRFLMQRISSDSKVKSRICTHLSTRVAVPPAQRAAPPC
eukprot:1161968-Pelagomonas_calceolata.AAC.1